MSNDRGSLLAAIGRALGQPDPYEEILGEREEAISLNTMSSAPIGHHREVLGGAADSASGRVAWVEQRSAPPEGEYVPVEIDLRFAWDGRLRAVIEPYTYNPYFGCDVHLARWFGRRFVLLYTEKHKTLLSHFDPPYRRQHSVDLGRHYIVDGDTVFSLDRDAALLRGRVLPAMTEAIPIPVPTSDGGHQIWLERPGVARIASLPRFDPESAASYTADLAQARDEAWSIDLTRTRP